MNFKRLTVVAVAALAVSVSACSSDSNDDATAETTAAGTGTESVNTCPVDAPAGDAQPTWTLDGATGSIAVIAPTDTTAPNVVVTPPFSVTETQVHTLAEGEGAVVPQGATVNVCYAGVNGRDGSTFDSSYQRGEPVEFPLDNVVPGFQKAIIGQKVGSSVAVAMVSEDGYPQGNPSAGINPGDSLIFVLQILSAN